MNGSFFFISVFCQLSVSCEIYSYHGRISSVLRQNRKKDCNKVVVDRASVTREIMQRKDALQFYEISSLCAKGCYHRRYYNSQQGRHYRRRVSIGGSFNG